LIATENWLTAVPEAGKQIERMKQIENLLNLLHLL